MSVDDVADDGDCLVAIEISPDTSLVIGQLVIVSRTRAGLTETTARRFNIVDERAELTFASSDARYRDQEPIRMPLLARKIKIDATDVELRGVVVFVYRQV